jgi:hypothetical protein
MDDTAISLAPDAALTEARLRAEAAGHALIAAHAGADARVIRAELKAEALRAGMVDLDGLKLVDLSTAKLNEQGEVDGGAALMAQLKREKPWLFGGLSSSSTAALPPAAPPRQKLATEMTDAEYRAARADLLKRRF